MITSQPTICAPCSKSQATFFLVNSALSRARHYDRTTGYLAICSDSARRDVPANPLLAHTQVSQAGYLVSSFSSRFSSMMGGHGMSYQRSRFLSSRGSAGHLHVPSTYSSSLRAETTPCSYSYGFSDRGRHPVDSSRFESLRFAVKMFVTALRSADLHRPVPDVWLVSALSAVTVGIY